MRLWLTSALLLCLSLPAHAQNRSEVRFVKSILNQLQPRSIAENREFCGYIGIDFSGRMRASTVVRGRKHSCDARWPRDMEVIASFHTHGAFLADTRSEVPSVTDMEADEGEGIDGYVATPGGRLWYIDTEDMTTSQLCGIGCLSRDPRFVRGADGPIRQSYTYNQLIRREASR